MDYSRKYLRASLDELDLDPDLARDYVDPRVLDEYESGFGEADRERLAAALDEDPGDYLDLISRSMLITYAVIGEIEKGIFELDGGYGIRGLWRRHRIPVSARWLMRHGTIGLLDRRVDPHGRRFGITVDLPRYARLVAPRAGVARFPRLRVELPLLITRSRIELHSPVHPANATTACYAERDGTVGVVTAGHAVAGLAVHDPVPLEPGPVGLLVRSGYRPIDAAFIQVPDFPQQLRPLPSLQFPVPGDELVVCTKRAAVRRAIADVGLTQVDPLFRDYPLNFLIDEPFEPGDSGALVKLVTGEAIGIYVGAQRRRLPVRPTESSVAGVAQNFAQAMYALSAHALEE